MKSIHLHLHDLAMKMRPIVCIDGEVIALKKNQFESLETDIQTDEEEFTLAITRDHELGRSFWWLYGILIFLLSFFGVFNPPYDRRCILFSVGYKIVADRSSGIGVIFHSLEKNGRVVELETDNNFEEIKNEYHVDKTLKLRWTALLILRVLGILSLVVLLVWLLINYINKGE